MKVRIAIMTFFLCLLSPAFLAGRTDDKKSAASFVAELKKKKNTSEERSNDLSYVSYQKKHKVKSIRSLIKKYQSSQPEKLSYIEKLKATKHYSWKKYIPKKINTVYGSQKNSVDSPATGKAVLNRVTMTSNPIKKLWNKIFHSKKSKSVDPSDLSLDSVDYEDAAKWAKDQGKLNLAKKVMETYGDIIKSLALEFNVDYRVIAAICTHESGGNPNAVSRTLDKGLMQIAPITAPGYGLCDENIFDPYCNLRAGTHYFSDMFKLFGNVKDALYGYGCGQGNADKGLKKGVQSDKLIAVQRVLYLAQNQ